MSELTSKNKILIIDDEIMICELAKDYLSSKGFEVWIAHDGKAGLDQVKAKRPDLILLDVNMPIMNGYQVLAKIREDLQTASLPVLMLASEKSENLDSKVVEIKADRYLPKPFMLEVLFKEVQQCLALHKPT